MTDTEPGPAPAPREPCRTLGHAGTPVLPSVSWKNCFNILHSSSALEEGQTDRGAQAGGAKSRGGPFLGDRRLLTRPPEEHLPRNLTSTNEVCTVNQDRRPGGLGIGPGDSASAQAATRRALLLSPAASARGEARVPGEGRRSCTGSLGCMSWTRAPGDPLGDPLGLGTAVQPSGGRHQPWGPLVGPSQADGTRTGAP